MEPVKGYRTSEFWISLAALIVGIVTASGVLPETNPMLQIIGSIAAMISAAAYTAGRSLVKKP